VLVMCLICLLYLRGL